MHVIFDRKGEVVLASSEVQSNQIKPLDWKSIGGSYNVSHLVLRGEHEVVSSSHFSSTSKTNYSIKKPEYSWEAWTRIIDISRKRY
jgi:hypothetical protein